MTKRTVTTLLTTLIAVAGLAGCASRRPPAPPRDAAAIDAEWALAERIEHRLVELFGADAEPVRVVIDRHKAILLGDVTDRPTQELAKEVALTFPGIASVSNRLRLIRPTDGIGEEAVQTVEEETRDAALESEVKLALAGEIGRWAGSVEVEAVDGVISLRGALPDEARRTIALETASGRKGVRRVIDLLSVQ